MIKPFDDYLFEFYQPLKFREVKLQISPIYTHRYYFFETDKWDYRVSVEGEDINYPFTGFKAKPKNSPNFFYDMDVITNDNIYLIISTVVEILKYDHEKYDNEGYLFSTFRSKKGRQREKFYLKLISKLSDWTFERDEDYDNYIYIKPK